MKHGRPRNKTAEAGQAYKYSQVFLYTINRSKSPLLPAAALYSIGVWPSLQDLISELITFGLPRHPHSVLTDNDSRWADYGRRLQELLFFAVVLIWALCKVVHWRTQLL